MPPTFLIAFSFLPFALTAQTKAPDFTGVWGIYRGVPGADPKFAPPAASALVLKPAYAKTYEARRAVEAEALQRGEQLGNNNVLCMPYGVPTMMAVAIYPV